jgi:hypothetical protein
MTDVSESPRPSRSRGRTHKTKSRAQINIDWIEDFCRVSEGIELGQGGMRC